MKKQKIKLFGLMVMLPAVVGCGAGGGGLAALFEVLFGNSAAGFGLGNGFGVIPPAGVIEIATLTNPEPASMLLLGSGAAAMAYIKAKARQRDKE